MHRHTWCLTLTLVLCLTIMLMASYTQAAQLELTWDPPTTNTDGTPLADLAGYKIYYGQSSGNYSETLNVGNVTSHLLGGLAEGKTYYFAAAAYDVSGNESDFSNEVSAAIPSSEPPHPPEGTFHQGSDANGVVAMEAEHAHTNTSQGEHSWSLISPAGASGTGAMEATPNAGTTTNTDYAANSPRLDFQVTFVRTGTHYVWVRGLGPSGADDSVHVGLNGQELATSDRISRFATTWAWSNATIDGVRATIEVPTAGTHTVNVWMREDGFVFDKLALTSSAAFIPSERGPAESSRDTTPTPAAVASQPTVSAPAASDTTVPTTGSPTATSGTALVSSSTSGENHTATGTAVGVVESSEAVMLWLEAEEGLHSGLMEIGLDDDASSGRYLWVPTGQEVALDPSQSNSEVRYTFTVPTADLYVIWGHVRPSATGTGSFFIALDSEASSSIGTGAGAVTDIVPQHYAVAPVQVGDTYYIDRTYTITAMPDELKGSLAINTANNSKHSSETTLLTFTVTQDATLYVAYDARATRFPDWLTASFTKTGQVLQTTDTALMLWKREVAAGPVVLPGNQFGNPVGARSHYVVFVATGASGQTATGPDYAIWTLPSNADLWMWDQAASDSSPVFFLEPGEYTLIIKQRDSGSQLDQLLITNNIEYQP